MFINVIVNSRCHFSSKSNFSDFLFLSFSQSKRATGDICFLLSPIGQKILAIFLAKISHLLLPFLIDCHHPHQVHTTSHWVYCVVLLIIIMEIVNIYWACLLCAKNGTKCFTALPQPIIKTSHKVGTSILDYRWRNWDWEKLNNPPKGIPPAGGRASPQILVSSIQSPSS